MAEPIRPIGRVIAGPQGSGVVAASTPRQGGGAIPLYQLGVGAIWRFLTTQPPSFWLVCIYLFLEYVRPQSIYQAIAFFPWSFWTIILCLAAFLVEGRLFDLRGPANWWLGVFTAIIVVSSVRAYSPSDSYANWSLWFSWILIYLLISNIVVTEKRFLIFILSFLLYNLKMSLFAVRSWAAIGFHFRDWGVYGAPGWFSNSGEFGIEMCVFVPIAVYFVAGMRPFWTRKKWLFFLAFPFTAVVGSVASSSRGALIGCGAVALWAVMKGRHKVRGLVIAVTLAALVILIIPDQQMKRFSTAGSDNTSQLRLTYWRHGLEMLRDNPLTGIGYFNWMTYYNNHYGKGQLPHNIFIQAASELGYPGLIVLLVLMGVTLVTNHRTRLLAAQLGPRGRFMYFMAHGLDGALIGFIASGFWVTVLYYPYMWINLALTVALHRSVRSSYREAYVAGVGLPNSRTSTGAFPASR